MNETLSQLTAIWKKLGINQKVTVLFLLTGVVAGIVALTVIARKPSYELLYSGLDDKDMAQVVSYLKESKIPYQVTDGGRTVMVQEGRKYDVRVALTQKDALQGGPAGIIETFGKTPNWATSPTVEQLMKRSALQGELARTIMHMEPVAWADVQIAQPEPSLFASDTKPTTAAITLKLKAGRTLGPSQVAGISRLAAGSIEGLEIKNVTIIDDQGALLSSPASNPESAEVADMHDYRRSYEDYLAGKAQAMLDRALGAGRSVVKVTALLDLDRLSQTQTQFDAANRVALKESTVSKSTAAEAGRAGAQSEETSESTYEVPRTVKTLQTAPGAVKHLDVAVIMDPTTTDKDGKEVPMQDTQVKDLELLIKRAVGLDEEGRKDTFKLTTMSFRKPTASTADASMEKEQRKQYTLQMVKNVSSVAAAVIFVGFAAFMLRRLSRSARAKPQESSGGAMMLDGEMYAGGNGGGQARLQNRVKDIIGRDPQAAARLLQRWINEDSLKKGKANG